MQRQSRDTFELSAISATAAFANRAVFIITEGANSGIDNSDDNESDSESQNINGHAGDDEIGNTNDNTGSVDNGNGNTVESGHSNDNAGEFDTDNNATDSLRSLLISKAKLFSDKEEIYKLLMSGCVNMMNAVQRPEYKRILNESHYGDIIQQCYQMKQFEPIPTEVDLIINEIFDALLPFRFE